MLAVETPLNKLVEYISNMAAAVSKLEEFQGHATDAVKTGQTPTKDLQTRAGASESKIENNFRAHEASLLATETAINELKRSSSRKRATRVQHWNPWRELERTGWNSVVGISWTLTAVHARQWS